MLSIVDLLELIKLKDPDTFIHSVNVSRYINKYCKYYKLPIEQVNELIHGALIHDIGKVFIDSKVLYKTSPLTDCEKNLIKKHTLIGYKFLKQNNSPENMYVYALYHHHRVDNKDGEYNFNKYIDDDKDLDFENYKQNIYLLNVCDSYDAMVSNRAYTYPKTKIEALKEISNCKNTQFNSKIADNFIYMMMKEDISSNYFDRKQNQTKISI